MASINHPINNYTWKLNEYRVGYSEKLKDFVGIDDFNGADIILDDKAKKALFHIFLYIYR